MSNGEQKELYTGSEWKDEQLAGELDGEWVKAVEGLTIEGKLVRAFCTAEEGGINPRACYAVKGTMKQLVDGKEELKEGVWLFGEKAAFKAPIREQKLDTQVRLTFLSQEPIMRNGKKTTLTMWKMKFQSKRDGRGELVEKALLTYWRRNFPASLQPNLGAQEYVPF